MAVTKTQKLSSSARSLLEGKATYMVCHANVLYERGLQHQEIEALLRKLTRAGAIEVQLRPRMAMVQATLPVLALQRVADLSQVQWIDIEKSAPLESVLDQG